MAYVVKIKIDVIAFLPILFLMSEYICLNYAIKLYKQLNSDIITLIFLFGLKKK